MRLSEGLKWLTEQEDAAIYFNASIPDDLLPSSDPKYDHCIIVNNLHNPEHRVAAYPRWPKGTSRELVMSELPRWIRAVKLQTEELERQRAGGVVVVSP